MCSCILYVRNSCAQCCAGSSGCSIAGSASTGVLEEHQIELSSNFQFISTEKFFKKDKQAPNSSRTFDSFKSTYQYFKIGYGVTKNLTFSVESGYYLLKKETGLNKNPFTTYESKGFGDLLFFPRYDIVNQRKGNQHNEITLGLGYKIPLGSYNDSTGNIEPFSGQTFYVSNPTSVQLTSGAQDIVFYTFFFRGYLKQNLKLFANIFYVKKGYNPNGEKLGDYASIALFAGKSFFNHFGFTLQSRYEWVNKMKINEAIMLFGKPSNYFPEATGYKKVYITPQFSYIRGKFTLYITSDFPVYQYVNSSDYYTQVGSQHQTTVGLNYRFFVVKKIKQKAKSAAIYYCPMHPEEISSAPGKCPKCSMDLEIKK